MSSNNKKDDLARNKEEIEILRRHILACPELPGNSCAIKAALNGLEKELQRMNRDQKLKEKFAMSSKKEKAIDILKQEMEDADTEIVDWKKESILNRDENQQVDDSILMEWQDVDSPNIEIAPGSTFEESILGKKLAEIALSKIANADAKVSDDLSAIALVLHSALLSEVLNFKCTGVPEPEGKKNYGFAKPIRELPKNKFVPDEFFSNENRNFLLLRYRKLETGSMILKLSKVIDNETNVNVQFSPTIAQPEPIPQGPLVFSLSDHLNLDSFHRALKAAQKNHSSKPTMILPTLHYKRLSQLLTNFVKIFDIGPVNDPLLDTTSIHEKNMNNEYTSSKSVPTTTSSFQPSSLSHKDQTGSYSMHQLYPQRRPGDFDMDVNSSGLYTPSSMRPNLGGNLMGPNHPMFQHRLPDDDDDDDGYDLDPNPFQPRIGGLGMQPRFDAFGPPGGPTDFRSRGRGRGRGGRSNRSIQGDPNNDHQRPPQNLDHMFM